MRAFTGKSRKYQEGSLAYVEMNNTSEIQAYLIMGHGFNGIFKHEQLLHVDRFTPRKALLCYISRIKSLKYIKSDFLFIIIQFNDGHNVCPHPRSWIGTFEELHGSSDHPSVCQTHLWDLQLAIPLIGFTHPCRRHAHMRHVAISYRWLNPVTYIRITYVPYYLGSLLLTWFNFNPNKDK